MQQSVFAPFIQYIRNQWISGDVFTVRDLSMFQMTIRANNYVEDYHYRINAKDHNLFSASLEFYLLCHLLKTEADQVVITVI